METLRNTQALAAMGLPDPANALVRLLSSKRMGAKKRVALLLYLEGIPVRQAARMAGLRDHMSTWRDAKRFGLQEIHKDRRDYREIARMTVNAQKYLQRDRKSLVGLARAGGQSVDALLLLRDLKGC